MRAEPWLDEIRHGINPSISFGCDYCATTRCRLLADTVARVENRTILEISRKLIFKPLCCCVAFFSATTEVRDRFGSTDMVPHIAERKTNGHSAHWPQSSCSKLRCFN